MLSASMPCKLPRQTKPASSNFYFHFSPSPGMLPQPRPCPRPASHVAHDLTINGQNYSQIAIFRVCRRLTRLWPGPGLGPGASRGSPLASRGRQHKVDSYGTVLTQYDSVRRNARCSLTSRLVSSYCQLGSATTSLQSKKPGSATTMSEPVRGDM